MVNCLLRLWLFFSPDKHLTVTFEGADYPHLGSHREKQRLIGWIVNILFAPAVSYWQTKFPTTSPFSESSLYSLKFLNCINCVNTTLLINPGMRVTFWSLTFMGAIFPLIIKQQFSHNFVIILQVSANCVFLTLIYKDLTGNKNENPKHCLKDIKLPKWIQVLPFSLDWEPAKSEEANPEAGMPNERKSLGFPAWFRDRHQEKCVSRRFQDFI